MRTEAPFPGRRVAAGPLLVALLVSTGADRARAACNLIPGTTKTFSATLGATDRPFAAPGESLEVALPPPGFGGSATDYVVTVLFTPPNGPHNVVVVAADCAALEAERQACERRSDVNGATCRSVDPGTDPQALALVPRDGIPHLSFRFPDTDALLAPAGDGRTFTGPATIAVTRRGDPLPCALSSAACSGQGGLVACVDNFFVDDGAGGTAPNGTFGHFTALPPPNDYQAACFDPSPPCLATASEVRFALDAAGNLLAPMDWRGILVRQGEEPVPRLLRATLAPPVPIRLPGRSFSASYTPEGGLLPPIFEPEADPSVPENVLTLFGSADAPYTILRIARRNGRCVGGPDDGQACSSFEDCPGGTCPTTCVGGADAGAACGVGDAPEGRAVARIEQGPFSFPAVAVEGNVVAFLEPEAATNNPATHVACDLNGDGDVADTILRVFQLGPTEVTAGTNVAVDAAPMIDGRSLAVSNGLGLFRASNAAGRPCSSACINPRVETAGGWSVLALGGGKLEVTGSAGGL